MAPSAVRAILTFAGLSGSARAAVDGEIRAQEVAWNGYTRDNSVTSRHRGTVDEQALEGLVMLNLAAIDELSLDGKRSPVRSEKAEASELQRSGNALSMYAAADEDFWDFDHSGCSLVADFGSSPHDLNFMAEKGLCVVSFNEDPKAVLLGFESLTSLARRRVRFVNAALGESVGMHNATLTRSMLQLGSGRSLEASHEPEREAHVKVPVVLGEALQTFFPQRATHLTGVVGTDQVVALLNATEAMYKKYGEKAFNLAEYISFGLLDSDKNRNYPKTDHAILSQWHDLGYTEVKMGRVDPLNDPAMTQGKLPDDAKDDLLTGPERDPSEWSNTRDIISVEDGLPRILLRGTKSNCCVYHLRRPASHDDL